YRRFNAEGDFRQCIGGLLRRMQLGSAAHHAIFDIGNDQRAVVGAFFGVTLDEAVVHEAMEAIMAAGAVEPQQMVAQQRQLFLLAESPNGALYSTLGAVRSGNLVVHSQYSSWWPSRRRRIPRSSIWCIAILSSSP